MVPQTFEKMCKKIFKFNRKIRYVAVLDKNGRIISGGMRRGIKALEPKEEELRLMAHIVSESSTRETWDLYFGKTLYTIIKREDVTLMVFPQNKRIVFITAEPVFNIHEIPDVREILIEHMNLQ
jgi:hypothetical protein|tara:strand:+ start:206 stop:577 length:372 start_codon:yes stop_codon:yes gene_type:complete